MKSTVARTLGGPEDDTASSADRTESLMPRGLPLGIVAAFSLTGFASLVYQVSWQRLLVLSTGVGVYSIAIITSSFLFGLGFGSHWGGVVSTRLSRRQSILAFVGVETFVAIYAALSVPFFHGVLFAKARFLYATLSRAAITHFLSLLPPTALMGASLPLLVRGVVEDTRGARDRIATLYTANTLGAAFGALATPWLFLRFLGVTGSLKVAAAVGAFGALSVLPLVRRVRESGTQERAPSPEIPPRANSESGAPWWEWVFIYGIAGFMGLSFEIVCFRLIDVAAKGGSYSFGTLLFVYLLCLGTGTFVSIRRGPAASPLAAFLRCLGWAALSVTLVVAALVLLPPQFPGVSSIVEFGARPVGLLVGAEGVTAGQFFLLWGVFPAVIFGACTFLSGFSFPLLQQATQADPSLSGFRVGVLQSANAVGCAAGGLVTGLVLFDRWGTAGVFRFLCLMALACAAFGYLRTRSRGFLPLMAALAGVWIVFPSNERLWLRFHGEPQSQVKIVEEDAASVTALGPDPDPQMSRIWVNGRFNSWLPYGWKHTIMGALPAFAHERPESIAIVGLGSGDTAWASGVRAETKSITVFEIAGSQRRLLHRIAATNVVGVERLREFLQDPRVTVVADDGRRRLQDDGLQYDVIAFDASWHDTSFAGNLYSEESYALILSRLKPKGLASILATTPRMRATMRATFPHIVDFGDNAFLVSPDPIVLDREQIAARLQSERTANYIGKARMREVRAFFERAHPVAPSLVRYDLNRDLDPRDEFARPPSRRTLAAAR